MTPLIIGLIFCIGGVLEVNVTRPLYEAEENHNVTMEWTFLSKPLGTISVSCYQSPDSTAYDLYHDLVAEPPGLVVYRLRAGVDSDVDDRFAGRVQCDRDAIRTGRIRLELSGLRTDDSGVYQCNVNTDYGHGSARCRLNVTAADRPRPPSPNPDGGRRTRLITGLSVSVVVALALLILFGVWRHTNGSNLMSRVLPSQNRTYGTQIFMVASAASSPSSAGGSSGV